MASKPPTRSSRKPQGKVSPLLANMLGQRAPKPPPVTVAAQPGWQATYDQALHLMLEKELGQALQLMLPLARTWPDAADVHNLTAVLLAQHRRFDEAIAAWQNVLALQPHNVAVLSNIGRAHEQMGQWETSLGYLQQALQINPQFADALLNAGVTLQRLERSQEAEQHYSRLLQLQPRHVQALFNLATLQQHRLDFAAAHATYQQVLAIDPHHIDAQANLIFTQHYLMPPQPGRIAQHARQLGQDYAALHTPYSDWLVSPQPERRLRIGIVSADLRDHPVGYFLEGLLGDEMAQQFEWLAWHNSFHASALTQRLQPRFAQWHVAHTWSDAALAAHIRQQQVDVLLDLSGYTAGHRMGVFARRPAPLQATWLGYWGTTGLPTMQAVIGDENSVPPGEEAWFTETVWKLPHTRFAFAPPEHAPPVAPLPALQRGHITFGCFQELAKINDEVLALWGRIAQQAPTARWRIQTGRLKAGSPDRAALLARLQRAGIEETRVSLHGAMPRADYWQAHAEVDVLLDTFCYPGGTTTTEALWMGVSTLTLATPGMLGRQGQQLLTAAGLPDWVCHTPDDYVAQAVRLAQPAAWPGLAQLRSGLRAVLPERPLFNRSQYAQDWAALVRAMWRDACTRGWPCASPPAAPSTPPSPVSSTAP